ncbi:UNKNOWN [Stylonychia lemnae]|uniref:Transmembrane protein n=1 Tax=Stylonychia lemnae TaxID=5949 RepID=A0A077ZRN8_STYLE|nr:UNKNOWN [Stylonychia lemnae]|eukprot:CDW71166.1 UNKNOWN [Stylonychia lemnae]
MYNTYTVSTFRWDPSDYYAKYQEEYYLGFGCPIFYILNNIITDLQIKGLIYSNNFAYFDKSQKANSMASLINHSMKQNDGTIYKVLFENVLIENNYAENGGRFFDISAHQIIFRNVIVQNNGAWFKFLSQNYPTIAQNETYQYQFINGFTISLTPTDYSKYEKVTFNSCTFTQNYGTTSVIMQNDDTQLVFQTWFKQCTFTENQSNRSLAKILYLTNQQINEVNLTQCVIQEKKQNQYIIQKYLIEERSTYFLATNPSLIVLSSQNNFYFKDGTVRYVNFVQEAAFILAQEAENVIISGSKFQQNSGATVSLISLKQTKIEIDNCIFDQNNGHDNGIILGNDYTQITINNSKFLQNFADSYSIFQNSMNQDFSQFKKINGNFIYAISDSNLIINGSTFVNGRGKDGGAVYFLGYSNFTILNSNFTGCQVDNQGGAIYAASYESLLIENTTFNENNAQVFGTSIYSSNSIGYLQIDLNSKFTSKNSQNYLYLSSIEEVKIAMTLFKSEANSELMKSNYSAVYLDSINKVEIINSKFEQIYANTSGGYNFAQVYGSDISSVAKILKQLTAKEYSYAKSDLQSSQLRILETSGASTIELKKQKSGGVIDPIYFALVDKYGSIVQTDLTSKLYLAVVHNSNYQFPSTFETSTSFEISNGTFIIDSLVFVGQPNSEQNGIDYSIPDNAAYYNSLQSGSTTSTTAQNVEIKVEIRNCEAGEAFLSSGKCQDCSNEQYLLTNPEAISACKDCQTSKYFFKSTKMKVFPIVMEEIKFIPELITGEVVGMNYPENNTLGACRQGYQGIICADCMIGYSRTGTYECSPCPEQASNSFKLLALLMIIVFALVFLIRSTLAGALEEKNYISVFIRVLMNHFQLLIITASFNFQWPDQLYAFFNSVKPVSEATTQFLSVDCFIDTRKSNNDTSSVRSFYSKTIILSIAPFIAVIICIAVWNLIYCIQDRKKRYQKLQEQKIKREFIKIQLNRNKNSATTAILEEFKNPKNENSQQEEETSRSSKQDIPFVGQNETINVHNHEGIYENDGNEVINLKTQEEKERRKGKIVSSVIIILFFIHPTITTQMFNAFNCQDIDGTLRLFEDLEVICYQGNHFYIALFVALPSIIIWCNLVHFLKLLGFGIPSYGYLLMSSRRNELNLVEVKERYGFLYNGYKQHSYYWEIFIMYRKLLIIIIQVFLAQVGKIIQVMKIFVSQFRKTNIVALNNNGKIVLFFLIVVINVVFFSYWTAKFIQELRHFIHKKFPKIYFMLFLCCNPKKKQQEDVVSEYMKKNQVFLKNYENICNYLVQRKNLYLNGMIPPEDHELQRLVLKLSQFKEEVDKRESIYHHQTQSIEKLLLAKEMDHALQKFKLRPRHEKIESISGNQGHQVPSIDDIENGFQNGIHHQRDRSIVKENFSFDNSSRKSVFGKYNKPTMISEHYKRKISLEGPASRTFQTQQNLVQRSNVFTNLNLRKNLEIKAEKFDEEPQANYNNKRSHPDFMIDTSTKLIKNQNMEDIVDYLSTPRMKKKNNKSIIVQQENLSKYQSIRSYTQLNREVNSMNNAQNSNDQEDSSAEEQQIQEEISRQLGIQKYKDDITMIVYNDNEDKQSHYKTSIYGDQSVSEEDEDYEINQIGIQNEIQNYQELAQKKIKEQQLDILQSKNYKAKTSNKFRKIDGSISQKNDNKSHRMRSRSTIRQKLRQKPLKRSRSRSSQHDKEIKEYGNSIDEKQLKIQADLFVSDIVEESVNSDRDQSQKYDTKQDKHLIINFKESYMIEHQYD